MKSAGLIEFFNLEFYVTVRFKDGTLVIWNLKTNEIRQHVNLNEILEVEASRPRANAIDQFDFDAKQNRLLVHTFKYSILDGVLKIQRIEV